MADRIVKLDNHSILYRLAKNAANKFIPKKCDHCSTMKADILIVNTGYDETKDESESFLNKDMKYEIGAMIDISTYKSALSSMPDDELNDEFIEAVKSMLNALISYVNVFNGESNSKKIKSTNATFMFELDDKDMFSIDDYSIVSNEPGETKANILDDSALKNLGVFCRDNNVQGLCLKIAYTVGEKV